MTVDSQLRFHLWAELRLRDEPATVPELADAVGVASASIAWRLSRWTKAGLLTALKPGNGDGALQRTRYIMPRTARGHTAPPSLDAARLPTKKRGWRAAMWRAIRVLKRFDLVQLCMTAEVTEASAKVYVSALLRAGILRRDVRGSAATGQRSLYALAGSFGPLVPVVGMRRENGRVTVTVTVTDPNAGTTREISAGAPLAPLF